MHPTLQALVALHQVDKQRQVLKRKRQDREQAVAEAKRKAEAAQAAATQAAADAEGNDALLRQYLADIERCDKAMTDLRQQQLTAKTNKDYLAVLNGVEAAKHEKTIREESIKQLNAKTAELKAKADAAAKAAAEQAAALDAAKAGNTADAAGDASEAELDRLYAEQRAKVDAKFLEVYERLIVARHPMPLCPINPKTRATPYGNVVSWNHIDHIQRGELVCDQTNKAILYLADGEALGTPLPISAAKKSR